MRWESIRWARPLWRPSIKADFIEAGRDFPGVELARKLAEKDLDLAVAYETKHTLEYLLAQNKTIYPAAILTYNAYVAGKNMEDFNG